MPSPFAPRTWTREVSGTTYTISTDSSLIQLEALNAAFASDMIYWTKSHSLDALQRCVEQSLCFGLYTPEGENQQAMVGFARLVTDYTTFGYLTDVYVVPAHQGRGLGKWLVRCLDEVLDGWPDLRRCLLLTRDEAAVRMYRDALGAKVMRGCVEGEGQGAGGGLFIMEKRGEGMAFLSAGGGEVVGGKGE